MRKKLSEIQEKTQQNMLKTRMDDYINLRELIKQKIIWVENEKKKANEIINQYNEKIGQIKLSLLKIEGAEIALNDLIKSETENK